MKLVDESEEQEEGITTVLPKI